MGKSALIQYMLKGSPGDIDPEIEDSFRKQMEIDGEMVLLDVLDVVPMEYTQPPFSMRGRDGWLRTCEGAVLVYDVTSRVSFERLIGSEQAWIDRWVRAKARDGPEGYPLVLVANKIDLVVEGGGGGNRVVSREEGEELASQYGFEYFETSAKTGMNVEQVFEACVRLIKAKRIEEEEEEAARAKKKCHLM